jgi:hypothetical protein
MIKTFNGDQKIKLAHNAEFGKAKQAHRLLETILETAGNTL